MEVFENKSFNRLNFDSLTREGFDTHIRLYLYFFFFYMWWQGRGIRNKDMEIMMTRGFLFEHNFFFNYYFSKHEKFLKKEITK